MVKLIFSLACRQTAINVRFNLQKMSAATQHEFIAINEGRSTLLHVNERTPSKNWLVPIGQPQARDMQLIGGNKILIGHHHGYTEFDIASGKILKEFKSLEGVTAARRQSNGHIGIDRQAVTALSGIVRRA